MSGPALVIVDMQYYFKKTAGRCLDGVLREVELAKERGAPIVIVEYFLSEGRTTFREIRSAIGKYKDVVTVTKYRDGGGTELAGAMWKKKWDMTHVRFAGVNRSFCVYATVRQFVDFVREDQGVTPTIEIAIDATWCHHPGHGRRMYSVYQPEWNIIRTEGVVPPYRHPTYQNRHRLPRNQRNAR